jgi:hypothetical protein
VESGLKGELVRRLASTSGSFAVAEVLPTPLTAEALNSRTLAVRAENNAEVGLGVSIIPSTERQEVLLSLITPAGDQQFARPYGGPPEYASRWAIHHSLDILRQI